MLGELTAFRDYLGKPHEFSFWRERTHEVDVLIEGPKGPLWAMELKTGQETPSKDTIKVFQSRFSKVPVSIVSLTDKHVRKLDSGVEVLPWATAIERYKSLK